MMDRRRFMAGLAGASAAAFAAPQAARASGLAGFGTAALRGTLGSVALAGALDATKFDLRPNAADDQGPALARLLAAAAESGAPVALPAGDFVVSHLALPHRVVLTGVPGATRIVHGGGGRFVTCAGGDRIELAGLVFDGAGRRLDDDVRAALDLRNVPHLVVDGCTIADSGGSALALERCGGRVSRSTLTGAADVGLYSVEATGLEIAGNVVGDCANGGILVHRWSPGEDGTLVSGNRIARIGAANGGTGQWGNGINLFRAHAVIVSGNHVSDCAFSAIRSNGGSNVQIGGNTCLRSGETGIYSEFGFEGAVISGNVVDGAAIGISIVNFNEGGRLGICSGNLVRNLSATGPYPADAPGFGIGISVEADTAVTGNVVEGAPLYGMLLGWGPFLRDVTATGNVIRKAGTGIAVSVVEGAGAAVIADNVISDTRHGAVVGHRWAQPVTGDLTQIGTAGHGHLTVEGNHAG